MNISGIILAGGESSRMGVEKGLVSFLGRPMIEHVIDHMTPACDELIISANNKEYERYLLPVVPDTFINSGPLAGIVACMQVAAGTKCLVASCDLPLVSTRLFNYLIRHSADHDITVFKNGDFIQPLCGVYNRSIYKRLIDYIRKGDVGLQYLLKQFDTLVLDPAAITGIKPGEEMINFNSRHEIKAFEKTLDKK